MKRLYFGTDGVRGPFGGPLINADFAARLGEAVGRWLTTARGVGGRVLIGRDTRRSGAVLQEALGRGFAAAGVECVAIGVAPTPAVAAAVVRERAWLGVMVTASHNPAEDNGIKFFNAAGMKLTDEEEAAIEALLPPVATTSLLDRPIVEDDLAVGPYRKSAKSLLPEGALRGWRIVLDTAHGATCSTSPFVLNALGAEVVGLGANPNGQNINLGCGSEHPEALAAAVLTHGARLGIAHDGDGDRCVLCDESGSVLDGDEIVAVLATHALAQGKLPLSTVVVTVQSNLGLDAAIRSAGGKVVRTQVGDRYVIEGLRATGARLGGESSGHIVALDVSTTGDGLVAALKVLQVMRETGKPISELRRVMRKFPQATGALKVREKKELSSLPTLAPLMARLEQELSHDGRILVRYSGTEPKLRLLVEGPNDEVVSKVMIQLEAAVRADLDVL